MTVKNAQQGGFLEFSLGRRLKFSLGEFQGDAAGNKFLARIQTFSDRIVVQAHKNNSNRDKHIKIEIYTSELGGRVVTTITTPPLRIQPLGYRPSRKLAENQTFSC